MPLLIALLHNWLCILRLLVTIVRVSWIARHHLVGIKEPLLAGVCIQFATLLSWCLQFTGSSGQTKDRDGILALSYHDLVLCNFSDKKTMLDSWCYSSILIEPYWCWNLLSIEYKLKLSPFSNYLVGLWCHILLRKCTEVIIFDDTTNVQPGPNRCDGSRGWT